jgi:hypothetical protein
MTNFNIMMTHDAIGMLLLMLFTLIGVSIAKTTAMKIIISIYAVLQFMAFLADFMFVANMG